MTLRQAFAMEIDSKLLIDNNLTINTTVCDYWTFFYCIFLVINFNCIFKKNLLMAN